MSAGEGQPPRPDLRELLKEVAHAGGIHDFVPTSSGQLAETLGVSQQTASRWLVELEEDAYLERRLGSRGQQLHLTDDGIKVLVDELSELEGILAGSDRSLLTGTVSEGDGEGAYYMSQPFYERGFEELFGFTPFPGTLNLQVEGKDLETVRVLRTQDALEIPKVQTPERTFGGVTGYPAEVEDIEAALIFPHRTRHERVAEVIAPVRLRDALDLEDGDELAVQVQIHPDGRTYNPQGEIEG